MAGMRSDRLSDYHTGWPRQRPPLDAAPAGLPEPCVHLLLVIGLAFTGLEEKFSRHQGYRRWLSVGRVHPRIDQQQSRVSLDASSRRLREVEIVSDGQHVDRIGDNQHVMGVRQRVGDYKFSLANTLREFGSAEKVNRRARGRRPASDRFARACARGALPSSAHRSTACSAVVLRRPDRRPYWGKRGNSRAGSNRAGIGPLFVVRSKQPHRTHT